MTSSEEVMMDSQSQLEVLLRNVSICSERIIICGVYFWGVGPSRCVKPERQPAASPLS